MQLTWHFQDMSLPTTTIILSTPYIVLNRVFRLGAPYNSLHSSFSMWLPLKRRKWCAFPTILNLKVLALLLYPGVWKGEIQMPSKTRIRDVWANILNT